MQIKRSVFAVLAFCFCLITSNATWAQASACPKTISTFPNNELADIVSAILSDIYLDVGCKVSFSALPNKRGIAAFNSDHTDGEIFRHTNVEKLYTKNFIRTVEPLFILNSSLFGDPQADRPMGYVRGIVWQEEFDTDQPRIAFDSNEEMFNAFTRGAIGSFLASDISVKLARDLLPGEMEKQAIHSAPLYHYLDKRFEDTLVKVSQKLREKPHFYVITQ